MLTEDRPITVGDAPTGRNHEFLFIEGDRIVGRVYADCLGLRLESGAPPLSRRAPGLSREALSVGNKPGALVYGGSHFLHRLTVTVVEAV